jgi:apolipoprotein N-acyltransferase
LRNAGKKDVLLLWGGLAATAALLTVIQPPISLSLLAWVALVPFILICRPDAKTKPLILAACVVSLAYWLGNLYWVAPVTLIGWVAFCAYTATLWPIVALALCYCRRKHISLIIAVPILFVGAERLQGFLLGGFFWRFLAHSQYDNIPLIQIADIFGAAGISFLIAMVNGLIAGLVIAGARKKLITTSNLARIATVAILVAAALLYGRWRIEESQRFVTQGPLVAVLQSNVPQSVKRAGEASHTIFKNLLADSNQAAQAGAKLIVWPETMVQAILNTDVWPLLVAPAISENFHKNLCRHAKDTCYLLVGAYGAEMKRRNDQDYMARYNSAFLYNPKGEQACRQYNKIHLVLFGEVVPFRRTLPRLYDLLMKFTPYNYDYSLDYGREFTIFKMKPTNDPTTPTHSFGVMICYEDTVPKIARKFAKTAERTGKVDWLVNISNDGWFVRHKDGQITATTELAQHVAVCVFRAVENRLAVIRSVNTGISCLIDSVGAIRPGFVAGNLPKDAMQRKALAGWFADHVPIDKRVTVYSRYGPWLDSVCAIALLALLILPALERLLPASSSSGSSRKTK